MVALNLMERRTCDTFGNGTGKKHLSEKGYHRNPLRVAGLLKNRVQ
jgi:hypothetical protein